MSAARLAVALQRRAAATKALCRAHPIWAALWAGLVCRLIAALTSYGWFAPDDLGLAIEQGHIWTQWPHTPMQDSIRSPILSWIFWRLMNAAHALGLVDPADVLRFVYACLGLYSLAAVPAIYALARTRLCPARAALAAWLMAVYALLPHISTRGLIEVVAIVPLLLGLWATEQAGQRAPGAPSWLWALLAGLGLGAATLVRFQLGLLFAPAFLRLYSHRKKAALRLFAPGRDFAMFGLGLGGAIMAALQLAMDLHMQRGLFGTLRGYVQFNVRYSQGLGTSPWWTYLGELGLFLLPPVGLWLVPKLWQSCRAHPFVASCLFFFVAVHSAIGHKEDRFMFTVLPLLLVLLADALHRVRQKKGAVRHVYAAFWALNFAALGVATTSDAHRNVTDPLLQIARTAETTRVLAVGFKAAELPHYYMGPKTDVRHVDNIGALSQAGALVSDWQPHYIFLRQLPDALAKAQLQKLAGLHCSEAQTFFGDRVDRLLVRVNKHNRLRAPTSLWACQSNSLQGGVARAFEPVGWLHYDAQRRARRDKPF